MELSISHQYHQKKQGKIAIDASPRSCYLKEPEEFCLDFFNVDYDEDWISSIEKEE